MKINNRLIAVLTILLFAGNILSILPLAQATVGGALHIDMPEKVAAGGPIFLDTTGMTATGGSMYFYLSLNDDPEISSGDIYVATVKTADGILDMQTIFLTASIPANEYYIKGVDLKGVGKAAVVSDNTIEVIAEGLPSVVNNDPTGNVGDEPEIEITKADDFDTASLYWKTFADLPADYGVADGEVTIDDYVIPNAFKGTYKILVLLDGDYTYATYVEFTVTPAVEWELPSGVGGLSIEADELDQVFVVHGTGFPEGTVAADSIGVVLKNFMTGSTIDTYETRHDKTDVDDAAATEGMLTIDVTIDAVESGVLDVTIPVGGSNTFAAAFYSSTPTAVPDFATITHYKVSATSGVNGDDVTFSFINLPSLADVTIRWIGATVTKDVVAGSSDLYGAYKDEYTLDELPGGSYSIRAVVDAGTIRERTMATFTVQPKFEISVDEAVVGDLVDLSGTGFPADASIQTSFFGKEEVDFGDINVLATGEFTVADVAVPHISGGGKDVVVKIEGEDADGVAINAQGTLIVNSHITATDALADDGTWTGGIIFPGHILRVTGDGFLAGETLAVSLYDADDKLIGSVIVGDGEKADADGDVELVAWLPNAKSLYPAGKLDCYLKVAGSTATNKDNTNAFDVAASDDGLAFIWVGIANDAAIDNEVKVGDTLRVVGVGFRTKTLTLTANGDDLKTVSSVNGYFDTTFTVPKLQGWWDDGEEYFVEVDETGATDAFYVFPAIVLSPSVGYVDSKFTVTGTGFEDGTDFDISWVGIIGNEVLDTVDGGDVEDGSFSIEVKVPTVVPQAYKVEVVDGPDVWKSAVYTVADKSAATMNATLNQILAQLKGVDFNALKTQVQSAQTTSQAAQTAATAASTAATAAGTKADAATAAATAAGTKADAAKTAADSAKTAADAAKTAADSAASAANGLTTLVYAAIGASLIAALAAIVALMQISRKIA